MVVCLYYHYVNSPSSSHIGRNYIVFLSISYIYKSSRWIFLFSLSSIWAQPNHICRGGAEVTWPEVTSVTWPEAALSGSYRKYVLRIPGFSPRFFLTIVVVQNVSLRMTDRPTGNDIECAHAQPKVAQYPP